MPPEQRLLFCLRPPGTQLGHHRQRETHRGVSIWLESLWTMRQRTGAEVSTEIFACSE